MEQFEKFEKIQFWIELFLLLVLTLRLETELDFIIGN